MKARKIRLSTTRLMMYELFVFSASILAAAPVVYGDAGDAALALLQDNTDGPAGIYKVGIYLKQVSGPVLEQVNESFVFEPASTIKVLHHLHAMLEVEAGNIALTDLIDTFTGAADLPNCAADCPNPCPVDVDPFQIELQTALQQMMVQSHNTRTQAVRVRFGETNINNTAQGLEMFDSLIQHRMGCGADAVANHNRLTLVDIGLLYEKVAANNLLPNNRTNFYNLMIQSRFFDSIIDQEAANLGLTTNEVNDFKSKVAVARKGGSYGLSDGQYRTLAGWVQFPFDCEGVGVAREYVYGTFVNAASNLDTQGTGNDISVRAVASELLRDVIIDALTSTLCARPPEITTPASNLTVGCDGAGNVAALNAWLNSNGGASASDDCGSISWSNDFIGLSDSCGATGSATVTFTATSDDGCVTNTSETMATFTIEDTVAPYISCAVDVDTLWPLNHDLVDVGLAVTVSDMCDDDPQVSVEVFSDEDDEDATGDGHHSPDAKDIAPETLRLRAERKGDADGRVYLIVVTAEDECGNVNHTCCTVTVTHDQSKASKGSVAVQAAVAEAECLLSGNPPADFVKVGDGPVIGPKQ